MNKSIVVSFLATLIFAACTSTPKSYIVEGVVPDESYNNQMVYMRNYENSKYTDSTLVVDGKFTFTGSVDTAVIRRLELGRLYANIFLENGKISVDMTDSENIKETFLNDELSKYLTEFLVYRNAINEKQTELFQKQKVDEETLKEYNEFDLQDYFIEIVVTFFEKMNGEQKATNIHLSYYQVINFWIIQNYEKLNINNCIYILGYWLFYVEKHISCKR